MKHGFRKAISFLCSTALLFTLGAGLTPAAHAESAPPSHLDLRVEGAGATLLDKAVAFTSGETLLPILEGELASDGIPYTERISSWGSSYLAKIGNDEEKEFDSSTGWMYMVNGQSPSFGMSDEKPVDGDSIVVYFGGAQTLFPTVTVTPRYPAAGQQVTVNVSATYDDYSNWPQVVKKTDLISGAAVTLDGKTVGTTDAAGNATFAAPQQAGTCSLRVSLDRAGNYPLIVRTGNIPLAVSTGETIPQTGGDTVNLNDPSHPINSIDAPYGTTTTAKLAVADNGAGKKTGETGPALRVTLRDGYRVFRLGLEADTTVTGPGSWDGSLLLPSLLSSDAVTVPGGNIRMAVKVGAGCDLTLDKPARLVLPLQSGKKAGFIDAAGNFSEITNRLSSDSAPAGFSGVAYYDDGTDLILYTTHFSTFVAYVPASDVSVSDSSIDAVISGGASLLAAKDTSYWAALALARAGMAAPSGFLTSTAETLAQNGGNYALPSALSMTVVGLRAAGADPQNFNGVNLPQKLYTYQKIDKSGLNGPSYALIALDSGDYTAPSPAVNSVDSLIAQILTYQNNDGSFSLSRGSEDKPDPDATAMAVTALAPHLMRADVQQAAAQAVAFLSAAQQSDGGYLPAYGSDETLESSAQVVVALSSIGIDPATDSRFVKNGKTTLDNLMSYRTADNGFTHTHIQSTTDLIATEQGVLALEAYRRYERHLPLLYDLRDLSATITSAAVPNPNTGSGPSLPLAAAACAAPLAVLLLRASLRRKRADR